MHLFWVVSRASGTAALLLSSARRVRRAAVGGKLAQPADAAAPARGAALATIVALVVHAVALLGDGYLKPESRRRQIPFVSDYQRD